MKVTSLEQFVGPVRESGTQNNYQICPVCGDTRFKVYVDPQSGKWWCFAHQGGGCVETPMCQETWAQTVLDQLAGRTRRDEPINWPERDMPRWEPLGKKAIKYLAKRGIDASTARKLGIVEMADRLRVVLPYVGPTGGLIYWSARAYSPVEDGPKYLAASGKHPLYVLPDWRPRDEIVVVEGAFDAIAVHQHTGLPVAALGGKSLPRYLQPELLALCRKKLTVVLDSDALGAALKIKDRLAMQRQVKLVLLPDGEDPASMGEAIKELL
jgi:hypothetical protein